MAFTLRAYAHPGNYPGAAQIDVTGMAGQKFTVLRVSPSGNSPVRFADGFQPQIKTDGTWQGVDPEAGLGEVWYRIQDTTVTDQALIPEGKLNVEWRELAGSPFGIVRQVTNPANGWQQVVVQDESAIDHENRTGKFPVIGRP